MDMCNKTHDQQQDVHEQKQNEMKILNQDALAHGDKAKYDRKQSQKLNAILLRARAPFQRGSYTEETECRRNKVSSMSNNKTFSKNRDPLPRPREEPELKCCDQRIDMNKVELILKLVHHIAISNYFSCS